MSASSITPFNYSALTVTKPSASAMAAAAATAPKQQLSQTDFLNLITTQMENQDPSHPTSSADMVTEMAQFGTLSGMGSLQSSFASFATSMADSQTLQATSLVGKQVVTPGSQGALAAGGSITGNASLATSASDVTVQITDSSGNIINS
jgi:flagellar basal-body rod modification protein FlgD